MRLIDIIVFTFLSTQVLFSQDIQINRQNKTIAVTAEESVTASAEIAVLSLGYHNYATTQEEAFRQNLRLAEKIAKALSDAKIPPENIETEKIRLGLTELDEKWTPDMKTQRQFEAQQSWHVTVSADAAQSIVDLAVRSGANEVEGAEWGVADPLALQAKASGAALIKARNIATQMANGLGTKLGELVYASNRAPVAKMWRGMGLQTQESTVAGHVPGPMLKLFPQKVQSQATVYAVFAIE